MHIRITSDSNIECGLGPVIDEISGATEDYFATRSYGVGSFGIGVILMCRDPELDFKPRVKFSKEKGKLYVDVMLSLDEMKHSTHACRKKIVAERIGKIIPICLSKYSVPQFDQMQFIADLQSWLKLISTEEGDRS